MYAMRCSHTCSPWEARSYVRHGRLAHMLARGTSCTCSPREDHPYVRHAMLTHMLSMRSSPKCLPREAHMFGMGRSPHVRHEMLTHMLAMGGSLICSPWEARLRTLHGRLTQCLPRGARYSYKIVVQAKIQTVLPTHTLRGKPPATNIRENLEQKPFDRTSSAVRTPVVEPVCEGCVLLRGPIPGDRVGSRCYGEVVTKYGKKL